MIIIYYFDKKNNNDLIRVHTFLTKVNNNFYVFPCSVKKLKNIYKLL